MQKHILQILLGFTALSAIAIAVGCGGGGGGSESPPSKAAFIREGNLICAEGTKERERLIGEGVAIRQRLHGQVPQKRIEQYNSEMMEIYEGEAEKLADLTPPVGDEKKIDNMVKAMYEGAEKFKANPEAEGVPFTKPDRMAQAYGLDKCVV